MKSHPTKEDEREKHDDNGNIITLCRNIVKIGIEHRESVDEDKEPHFDPENLGLNPRLGFPDRDKAPQGHQDHIRFGLTNPIQKTFK